MGFMFDTGVQEMKKYMDLLVQQTQSNVAEMQQFKGPIICKFPLAMCL